jgi:ABC-type transporter Mla MlaB component
MQTMARRSLEGRQDDKHERSAMVRISQVNGQGLTPTLKVEGKLLGPWVAELGRACEELQGSVGCLSLDLSALTFVDITGLELLRELLGRGVTLTACSGLVAELLHGKAR